MGLQQYMKDSNLFLAEVWVGNCKISRPVDTQIGITFRIGRTITHSQLSKMIENNAINFNSTLQLNTDRSALDTHRCSLTLTYQNGSPQGAIAGIALINIPKQLEIPCKNYKLMQCGDKKGMIELSLKIRCLEQSSSVSRGSSSSFRSILEMKDFDRKVISPPKLFNGSDISETSIQRQYNLLPPRPRASRERDPLIVSIHSHAIEENRVQALQNECNCLKKLLRLQISKNKDCTALIDKLAEALESNESTCCAQTDGELDQTLLIEQSENKKGDSKGSQIEELHDRINELELENRTLKEEKRELEELLFKISKLSEEQMREEEKGKGRGRMQLGGNCSSEADRKFQKLTTEINHLQEQLMSKQQQLGRYKKKMKIDLKFSSLKHIDMDRAQSPTATIKALMQRQIAQKKTMINLLMNHSKKDRQPSKQILFVRMKQKIEKCFNSMISKKLNKDILIYERGELLKNIEEAVVEIR